MTYVYAFDHPHEGHLDEIKAIVGGKGANLAVIKIAPRRLLSKRVRWKAL